MTLSLFFAAFTGAAIGALIFGAVNRLINARGIPASVTAMIPQLLAGVQQQMQKGAPPPVAQSEIRVRSTTEGKAPTPDQTQALYMQAVGAIGRAFHDGGCVLAVTAAAGASQGDQLECFVYGPDEFVADAIDTLSARYSKAPRQ